MQPMYYIGTPARLCPEEANTPRTKLLQRLTSLEIPRLLGPLLTICSYRRNSCQKMPRFEELLAQIIR